MWEYKKIVGYDTSGSNEVLIAVSNRQKVSGIRYDAGSDFVVDASLNAAVERFRGNEEAVIVRARTTLDDLRARLEDGKRRTESISNDLATQLVELVGTDETRESRATLRGGSVIPDP